jgi:chemotaxis protein MotB
LQQAAFFPSGEDTISPTAYPSIEKISTVLKQLPNPVRLEGHTDSIPISTPRFRSNWDLSAARAIAMMELLGDKFGVPRNKLAIAGYADTIPMQENNTDDGRARNRRVDVVILARGGMVNEPTAATAATAAPGKQH